jgi:signal transduction histidine kinase
MPFDIKEAAREMLPKRKDDRLPPLSFLAAPILHDRQVLGVLRCCVAKSAPHYFNKRQLELLCLVADHIGGWCGEYFRLKRAHEKRQWLQAYVQGISMLNRRAHEILMAPKGDFENLYSKALETAKSALPEVLGISIHLHQGGSSPFTCRGAVGSVWQGAKSEDERGKASRILSETVGSALADSFELNEVIPVPDLTEGPYRVKKYLPASALAVAPISSGARKFGVIVVLFDDKGLYFDQAVAMIELLGRQLGMYLVMADTLSDLRAAKDAQEQAAEMQLQTFENLQHQLKTPIYLAHRWARRLASRQKLVEAVPEIARLKGQIRRVEQIVSNIQMFADLARGNALRTNRTATRISGLADRLAEAVRDHNLVLDPDRNIRFVLDHDSFKALDDTLVWLDLDLLDQMVDNLLDNAGKYSDINSPITVRCAVQQRSQVFYISVSNRGRQTPITSHQARTLAERGQRGDKALWKKQEGWGLGLYIVREILAAHGGKLDILSTNENGITDVRLLFPNSRPTEAV